MGQFMIYIDILFFQTKEPKEAAGQPTTTTETLQKQAAYAPISKNAKDLNQALAYFTAKDMMPFQIVERLFKAHEQSCSTVQSVNVAVFLQNRNPMNVQ